MAAVGLGQNLAALRALATDGIQKGHMALHARSVATAAGAGPRDLSTSVVERLIESGADQDLEGAGDHRASSIGAQPRRPQPQRPRARARAARRRPRQGDPARRARGRVRPSRHRGADPARHRGERRGRRRGRVSHHPALGCRAAPAGHATSSARPSTSRAAVILEKLGLMGRAMRIEVFPERAARDGARRLGGRGGRDHPRARTRTSTSRSAMRK